MALKKRKKKALKGGARVKAAKGGKSTPKSAKKDDFSLGEQAIGAIPGGGLLEQLLGLTVDAGKRIRFGPDQGSKARAKIGTIPDIGSDAASIERARSGFQSAEAGPFSLVDILGRIKSAIGGPVVPGGNSENSNIVGGALGNDIGRIIRGGEDDKEAERLRNQFILGASESLNRKNLEGKAGHEQRAPGRRSAGNASIPRGKHGGTLMANAANDGQDVARVRAASGGVLSRDFKPVSGVAPPPVSNPGIEPPAGFDATGQVQTTGSGSTSGTSESSGTSSTVNTADTGAVDNIVNKLLNVQGSSDLGRTTLDEILRTGLPTDVSGITAAAKIRGQQEFDDAQNVIGERLANLGLVSSSAQTSAVAREKGKLAELIAASGMEAEVADAQRASDRRAAGVSQDTAGQSVQSGALGSGGSLALGAAGLNTQSTTNTSATGSTTGETTNRGTVQQQTPNGASFGRPPQTNFGGGGIGSRDTKVVGNNVVSTVKANGPSSGTFSRPLGFAGARGGRVPEDQEFERFLQSLGADLGKTHHAKIKATPGTQGAQDVNRNAALTGLGGEAGARFLFENPEERNRLAAEGAKKFGDIRTGTGKFGPQNVAQFLRFAVDANPEMFGSKGVQGDLFAGALDAGEPKPERGNNVADQFQLQLERMLAEKQLSGDPSGRGILAGGVGGDDSRAVSGARDFGLDPLGPRGSATNRKFFAAGGPVEQNTVNSPNKGAVPQPTLPQEEGQVIPGLLDPRRQFFEEGGGTAPGIDSGEDKVPAMLRSEELVVVPELVEDIQNADPELPQPGLITALQQLAQQPLQFSEEEGELVGAHGGQADFSRFADPRQAGSPAVGAHQQGSLLPQVVLDFLSQLAQGPGGAPGVDIPTQFAGPELGPPSPRPLEADDLSGSIESSFGQPSDSGVGQASEFNVPLQEALRPPSFSETVGEGGERSFSLTGGGSLGGPADIRGGLDPTKGLLSGGEGFAPEASRQTPGGAGSISGSAAIIDPETGLPMDFGGKQLTRLERAQRTADLTRAALRADPIGGPKKQARMFRALEVANREMDASVNDMLASQQVAFQRQQAQVQGVVAQGKLNESVAHALAAEAQKATAEGALAKQVSDAALNNPVIADALKMAEILAKNPDANPKAIATLNAIMDRHLQSFGMELTQNDGFFGWFRQLFGAPGAEISQTTPQQGLPDQPAQGRQNFADGGIVDGGVVDGGPQGISTQGQNELNSLMSRAKAGMSAEDFQRVMEFM